MLVALKRLFIQPALISSAIATLLMVGVQKVGLLETFELKVFDVMMQNRQDEKPDPRILIVGYTEKDIQEFKLARPNDEIINNVIAKLQRYQPNIIGLDFLRDVPIEPGGAKLLKTLQNSDNIIAVCKHRDQASDAIAPPPGSIPESVGFADIVEDGDNTIRRALIALSPEKKSSCSAELSFSFLSAASYLDSKGIKSSFPNNNELLLGKTKFKRLDSNSGAYVGEDEAGFQIILNYRHRTTPAVEVSFVDVLNNKVDPSLIKDRIVLLGATAPSLLDVKSTPFASGKQDASGKMAGVVIHSQIISQILSSVLDNRRLFWFWSDGGEILWVWGWSLAGGLIALFIQHPIRQGLAVLGGIVLLIGSNIFIFTQAGWIPLLSPLFGLIIGAGIVISYNAWKNRNEKERIERRAKEQEQNIVLLQDLLRNGTTADAPTQILNNTPKINSLINNRYQVDKALGAGGFSHTYIAKDTKRPSNPDCVIKYLQPARNDEEFLEVARRLFRNEAEILEVVGKHDRIPELLAYFEENINFFLIQEYIVGNSLSDEILPNKPLPEATVRGIVKDVCEILVFVHEKGVIHRDIKPSNLIRRYHDNRIVLIDFGAVKVIQPQELEGESQTIAVGTMGYASPEQMMGQPRFNSDIFALGMLAIQGLTGKSYKELERDDKFNMIWRHFVPNTNPTFADILDKMVAYSYARRYQTSQEVLEDLKLLG
jgi:CHASE2 domain-containing sensor protein/tRNA A-37 threonylcarbamoyl transferase component Bud32